MKKIIQFTSLLSIAAFIPACSTTQHSRASYSSGRYSTTSYSATASAPGVKESSGAQTQFQSGQGQQNEVVIPLHEEQLNVGKRTVNAGQVRIRKVVTTDTVSQPVELRRETVVIERQSAGGETTEASGTADINSGAPFQEKEITIQLHEEQPVVEKQTVVTGKVVARKAAEMERTNVKREIRREDVQLDRSGNTANVQIRGDLNEPAGAQSPKQEPKDKQE